MIPYSIDADFRNAILQEYFNTSGNTIENPGLIYSVTPFQVLPSYTIFENTADYNSQWFDHVSYKGAFGSRNWAEGWSLLWRKDINR